MTTAPRPDARTSRARVLAPSVLAALAGLLVLAGLAGPASAATGVRSADAEGSLCSDGQGVSVVVDPGSLGGAVQQDCVEDGGGQLATDVFASAGHELTPVGEFPGAACKVDGEPADAACQSMPPADAYWGLYLATGDTWDYAPKGADELTLEDGAFVAFAWQDSSESTPPSVEPVAASGSASGSASASPSPSTGADLDSPDSGDSTAENAVESTDDNDLSQFIPIAVIVLLVLVVGFLLLRRRRDAGEG
ncbi:hypothetical protein ASG49_03395 [Marmoricola sp. Leaf446]|uniref:hypothetical protein n=1 Tax=Marmoricola sp. Leaf446 TaxID=1736379 RepID=UPI0006FD50CC|nr:hypothetical protein [Marmoricola sp. Leaf446]KQT93998.1 hypothetical protein ASG49_03395 [Marmoricola sp. Leaf446]